MAIVSSTCTANTCQHCLIGRLTESTTTYSSSGTVYDCSYCERKTYGTTTIVAPVFPKKEEKKETWFERDKREKKLLNQRKRNKKRR